MNGHDPYAYLKDVLTRLPTQKASEIEQSTAASVDACLIYAKCIPRMLTKGLQILIKNSKQLTFKAPVSCKSIK